MNPTAPQPQEDKTLRQSCLKLAIFTVVGILFMMAMVAPLLLMLRPSENTSSAGGFLLPVLTLVIGIGGLVLMFYLYRWIISDIQKHDERSGEIIQRTLPDLPVQQESEASEKPLSGKLLGLLAILIPLLLLLMFALVGVTRAVLKRLWPDVPHWVQEAATWMIILGGSLIVRRFVHTYPRKRGSAPTISLKEDAEKLIRTLLFFLLFMPPLFWVIRKLGGLNLEPLFMGSAGLVFSILAFALLFLAYTGGPYLWIVAAAQKGTYDQALWRVQIVEKLSIIRSIYLDIHGHILFRAGRYTEAEQVLRTGIVETRRETTGFGGAFTLNALGYALMGQGKNEEVRKVFEGALALEPNEGSFYDSLADAYLSQGIETDKALDLLDQALTRHQSSWFKRWSRQRSISTTWAGRAWALARLGRRAEAGEALDKAFALAPRKRNADFVEILYRAGHALALLGETRKAAEHFAEAQRLEPHGHYGRLCAEAASRLRGTESSIG